MRAFSERSSRQAPAHDVRRDSNLFSSLAGDLLARGLSIRFRAGGQSMRPAIGDGETIEVCPAEPMAPHRGDILLTQGEDGFKAHRVVGLSGDGSVIQTRGDASRTTESRAQGRILGKVVAVERNGRRIGLGGRARIVLQAAQRLGYCLRAALAARVRRVGR
jgi:hypothetical protein